METGMLHTHHLMAVLYILYLLVHTAVLLWGSAGAQQRVASMLRIPHIVVTSLLLVLGVFLLFRAPNGLTATHIMMFVVGFAAMGLSHAGAKRGRWPLLAGSLVLALYSYGIGHTKSALLQGEQTRVRASLATAPTADTRMKGRLIYQEACQRCHGPAGDAGYRKATNLRTSTQSSDYKAALIKNGKGIMPAYAYLSTDEVGALVQYINTLK